MQNVQNNPSSSSISTHPRSESSSKIKLNCILSDSCNEFHMELSDATSIRTLKRRISEKLNLEKSKMFNVIYNEKNLTNFNQLKLSDLFSPSSSRNENFYISSTHDCDSENKSQSSGTELNSFRLKIEPYESQSRFSQTKIKYMLECSNHFNENAHYYCFDCMKSFCALCIEEHSTHDFLDKYDYSKSNKEIVEGIIKNFILSLKQSANEQCKNNAMINKIVGNDKIKKEEDSKGKKIKELLNEVGKSYDEYCIDYEINFNKKLNEKFEDFKDNLKKFKIICMNNLSNAKMKAKEKKKTCNDDANLNDIILIDDDYFKQLHSTVKELNKGKEALMNYINARNEEMNKEVDNKNKFDIEIQNDINSLIAKIKGRYTNKISHSSSNNIIDIIQTESNNTIYETENFSDQSTMKLEDLDEGNNISNYIMKRKLNTDIIIYNPKTKQFDIRKNILQCNSKIKRFLNFSVYINANNLLYISGGKTKDDKCKNTFYKYSPNTNTLTQLASMLTPRCSHSMIDLNNEIYVVGGYNTNTCEKYLIQSNEWKNLPKLNSKERQVSTLFAMNNTTLYCAFGFIRGDSDGALYAEKLNTKISSSKWMKVNIKCNNIDKSELKKFNVGIIKLKEGEFIICGGENGKNEESDCYFTMKVKSEGIEVEGNKEKNIPIKCSFIDKEFNQFKEGKYGQFEMKKNSFVIYDVKKKIFKVKNPN